MTATIMVSAPRPNSRRPATITMNSEPTAVSTAPARQMSVVTSVTVRAE
jgi:hypothetical protein